MSTVIFDGQGNMPELNRITAKKNYASSSQSHKMGATAMFNDILHYLAKEKYPNLLNEVGGNVAVRQHPVYAFEKTKLEGKENQYTRKFIGLFTVGPDKGDKGFFGFTNEAVKDKAIRLEGTDHIKGVGFNYPWEVNGVKNIRYNADKEALCIVTGSDATNWTAIFEQSYCGNKKTEADIEAYLEEKYRPAYEVAYYNNPLIVGVDKTIKEINSDIKAFGKLRRTSDDRQYSFCEFWIDGEYDIYYLNKERNIYEKNGINILTDLGISEEDIAGLSIDEKNELFIQKRVERFKEECPKKFNKEDAIFQLMILFIMVASDNFEKNMYPYIMDLLWRFFQDDLDSIFSTDNQAQDTKKYSAELHDFTDDTHSAYVFKGEDSAFWQLIELAYPAECKKMGYDILQAMYDMTSRGTTTTEKLMAFFEDYFFDRAQDYFTPSAYNNDTEYSYEEAWNNKEYVAEVDIHPLAQALGGHEVTERAFLEKRIIFLMSKFGFGGFSSAEDTALGLISFRTQTSQSFTLTPAIDMYPAIIAGQSGIAASGSRIMAGESVTLYPGAGGNTNTYIVGADWLSDIGDLKDFQIDPSSNTALTIGSKRLRRIKVGDENPEEVTSNLTTLSVQQCDSLESIDARNLKYLGGNEEEDVQGGITIDLTRCPRLIEALFGGTNVKEISIAPGSKIEKLQLPDNITVIDLRNTKFLEDIEIGNLANVRFLRIEDVPALNGFAVLKEAYNSDGQQLKDIRLLNFSYDGDANDITMLANIASNKDKYNNNHPYNGIDPDNGKPNSKSPDLQGTLSISGGVYENEINKVESLFNGLTIKYDPTKIYMRFADQEVLNVLLANGVGDGTGITTEQAAAVTSIGTWFKGNTTIKTFNEFGKFTGVTYVYGHGSYGGAFQDCSSLTSIELPNTITALNSSCFRNCTNLKAFTIPKSVTTIQNEVFAFASNFNAVVDLPNLTGTLPYRAFYSSGIIRIENLGNVTSTVSNSDGGAFGRCASLVYAKLPNTLTTLGAGTFRYCSSLAEVVFPKSITSIGVECFQGCTSLEIEDLQLPNLTTLGQNAFYGVKIKKLVLGSDGVALTLPTATSSTQNFGDKSVLEEVVLPEGVTSIPAYSFYNYTNMIIKDLNMQTLTSIGNSAFRNTKIENVSNLGSIVTLGNGSSGGEGVFQDCTSLTRVVLPEGLTTIGGYAFSGCTSLAECNIPSTVTKIMLSAFAGTALKRIIIPEGVTTITRFLCSNCSQLELLDIPSTITYLQWQILKGSSATTLICRVTTPPSADGEALRYSNLVNIYVPDSSVEAYKNASMWVNHANKIKPLSEYVES